MRCSSGILERVSATRKSRLPSNTIHGGPAVKRAIGVRCAPHNSSLPPLLLFLLWHLWACQSLFNDAMMVARSASSVDASIRSDSYVQAFVAEQLPHCLKTAGLRLEQYSRSQMTKLMGRDFQASAVAQSRPNQPSHS